MTALEGFIQLPLDEYERLREAARMNRIPVTVTKSIVENSNGFLRYRVPIKVNIDMRKLKLLICDQNGIDPYNTIVQFY